MGAGTDSGKAKGCTANSGWQPVVRARLEMPALGSLGEETVGPAPFSLLPDVLCEPTTSGGCVACFDEDLVRSQRLSHSLAEAVPQRMRWHVAGSNVLQHDWFQARGQVREQCARQRQHL